MYLNTVTHLKILLYKNTSIVIRTKSNNMLVIAFIFDLSTKPFNVT